LEKLKEGTGSFEGCLINTTFTLGPYVIEDFLMTAATEVDSTLAGFSSSFSGMLGLGLNRVRNNIAEQQS
jgi:hypothetical protein